MTGKDGWPAMGQIPQEIREHGTLLLVETKEFLARVQKKKDTPPMAIIERYLTMVATYLEREKNSPTTTEVLDAIDKLTVKVSRNHEKIEEDTTVIRKKMTDFSSSPPSSSSATSTTRSWASVASRPPSPPKATISKDTEIIVRLNDSTKKQQYQTTEAREIITDINASLEMHEITNRNIRAIKKLPSGDIAIHTVSAEEATKLRKNDGWVTALGKHAKQAVQTYALMVQGGVNVGDWNLLTAESRAKAIEQIKTDNFDVKELTGMSPVWIGWRKKPSKDENQGTMVIEVTDSDVANAILRRGLMIGREIRACSVFNKACRSIQCFKCYQYGHTTVQCTREERCGHCAGSHATKGEACPPGYKPKCCACGGDHKPWMRACPEKQKEIQRILYQKSITPDSFPTKAKTAALPSTSTDTPYFGSETFDIHRDHIPLDGPDCTGETVDKRRKTATTRFANTVTPTLAPSLIPPRGALKGSRARSASPTKEDRNAFRKRGGEESEKGGSFTSTARTPLQEVDTNRVATRSTQ